MLRWSLVRRQREFAYRRRAAIPPAFCFNTGSLDSLLWHACARRRLGLVRCEWRPPPGENCIPYQRDTTSRGDRKFEIEECRKDRHAPPAHDIRPIVGQQRRPTCPTKKRDDLEAILIEASEVPIWRETGIECYESSSCLQFSFSMERQNISNTRNQKEPVQLSSP